MIINKIFKVPIALFLTLMLIMNSALAAYATAEQTETIGSYSIIDEMSAYELFDIGSVIEADVEEMQFESVSYDVSTYSTLTKTYTVNWTVAAGSTSKAAIKTFMSVGDTMTFNISYTPTNASVNIGVYTPRKTNRTYSVTNGSLSTTMTMIDNGVHQFLIVNNSTSAITVTGTFSFTATSPFEYMFKDPYMATKLSSQYGEVRDSKNHYAIDIISASGSGVIKGYPVYNTLSGKVIKNGLFSDNVTTCVAITHDNGFTSRFLHMDLTNNGISSGSTYSAGKQIGKVSDQGSSGAYHLHYDLNTIGAYAGTSLNDTNTIDPTLVFPNITFTS